MLAPILICSALLGIPCSALTSGLVTELLTALPKVLHLSLNRIPQE